MVGGLFACFFFLTTWSWCLHCEELQHHAHCARIQCMEEEEEEEEEEGEEQEEIKSLAANR